MPLITRAFLQTIISLVLMGLLLCWAGDDWLWPQAWTYVGETGAMSLAIGAWLAKNDPALLEARMTSPMKKGQRPFDRVLIIVIGLLFPAWLALMGLDAKRFEWTSIPLWGQIPGAVLVAACMVLCWETFRANRFAVPQVRVQQERQQTVVTTGPYRYVRHPMYSGALLYFFGVPLMLGSLWGLAGGVVLTLGLVLRALGEERVLRDGLPGYEAYMTQTPWRLVPGVW